MLCGGRRRYCVLERGLQQHFLLLLILKQVQVVLAVILSNLQFVAAGVCGGICRHVKSSGSFAASPMHLTKFQVAMQLGYTIKYLAALRHSLCPAHGADENIGQSEIGCLIRHRQLLLTARHGFAPQTIAGAALLSHQCTYCIVKKALL